MSIHERVIAASRAIAAKGIGREAYNKEQGFWYRRIEDVVKTVNEAINAAGLVIHPEKVEMIDREVRERKSGGKATFVTIRVEYVVSAVGDGATLRVSALGEGADSMDKAVAKAMTAAYKSAMGHLFHIPFEGIDPENSGEEPEADDKLLEAARAAAAKGMAEFTKFWKALGREERASLGQHLEELERIVKSSGAQS